jgi:hypothetical protein
MDTLDKFFKKYSYKFPKGYPDMNNEQDILLLESILGELGINTLNESNKPLTFDDCKEILLKQTNLKPNIVAEIEKIFNANPNDQKDFLNNFKKHPITDLDQVIKTYKNYVDIRKEGLGRGEIAVLLGIKDSISGGTAEKDIKIGSDIYDVKELSSGEFRTAASGNIVNTSFQKNYNYFMDLLSKINEDNKSQVKEAKKEKELPTLQNKIDTLINYYNTTYTTGNISAGVISTIKSIIPELESYIKKEENIEDKPYIKIGDKKYEINDLIKDKDGVPTSVSLGLEVKKQNVLIKKLLNHPWVKNTKKIDEDLNEIFYKFLNTVQGLIINDNNDFNLYNDNEIKTNFTPHRIVQNQLTVIKKKNKENISKDEEQYL